MYEEFYGFHDNPFRLTPDPDYLFLSTNHQEALGHLLFGVSEGSVLEQLRLLPNLETEHEKLLQILLVGQPELRDMLARPELAQLDQRVTLRWHLKPLAAGETAAYVRHRLRVAAKGREPVRFTAGALRQVYRFSRGVPRVINVLCHRALLISYTHEERQVGRAVLRQAIKDLRPQGREGY